MNNTSGGNRVRRQKTDPTSVRRRALRVLNEVVEQLSLDERQRLLATPLHVASWPVSTADFKAISMALMHERAFSRPLALPQDVQGAWALIRSLIGD